MREMEEREVELAVELTMAGSRACGDLKIGLQVHDRLARHALLQLQQ
jgi:hypothetical protein